jgi:hypothetical protein
MTWHGMAWHGMHAFDVYGVQCPAINAACRFVGRGEASAKATGQGDRSVIHVITAQKQNN